MAYPKQLSPLGEQTVLPYLKSIEALREGESITFSDTPQRLITFRYYLYAWLAQQDLKSFFKIKQLSKDRLLLMKLRVPQPKIVEEDKLSFEEEFVLNNLLDVESIENVELFLSESDFQTETSLKILTEWKRVMGLG